MAKKSGGKRKAAISGLECHRGRWRWRPTTNGKRETIPLLATSEAAAIAEVIELQSRPIRHGAWNEALEKYFRYSRSKNRLGETTISNRRPILQAAGDFLQLASTRSFTPALAVRWGDHLRSREDLSPRSRADYVQFVSAFCKWCAATGRMTSDPTEAISMPVPQAQLRNVFLPALKVAELLQHARDEGDRDLEFILGLGFECGMRRGEISVCRPEWFNIALKIVIIPAIERAQTDTDRDWKRKSMEGRSKQAIVSLSDVMLEMIDRHKLPSPFVVNPKKGWGKSLYRFDFRKRYNNFMERHGVGHVTIHDMRRSFASNKVSAGVSIEKVANWMGCTPEVAWENYSRFLPGDEEINRGSAKLAPQKVAPVMSPQSRDIETRLTRLDDLAARGIISESERATQRSAILATL